MGGSESEEVHGALKLDSRFLVKVGCCELSHRIEEAGKQYESPPGVAGASRPTANCAHHPGWKNLG